MLAHFAECQCVASVDLIAVSRKPRKPEKLIPILTLSFKNLQQQRRQLLQQLQRPKLRQRLLLLRLQPQNVLELNGFKIPRHRVRQPKFHFA